MIRSRNSFRTLAAIIGASAIGASALAAAPLAAQQQHARTAPSTVMAVSAGTVSPTAAAASPTPFAPATVAKKNPALPAQITIQREIFDYNGSGRRDPYKSLMSTSDIRPLLSDLRLTAVAFDPDGDNSVAILRDSFSKQQYRIRVGQQLGRLRVSGIKQKSVQFTLDEFGFNRQETLQLSSDTTKLRNP